MTIRTFTKFENYSVKMVDKVGLQQDVKYLPYGSIGQIFLSLSATLSSVPSCMNSEQ